MRIQSLIPINRFPYLTRMLLRIRLLIATWELRYHNPPPILMGLAIACMSARTDYLVCEQTSIQESHLIKEGSSSIEQSWQELKESNPH